MLATKLISTILNHVEIATEIVFLLTRGNDEFRTVQRDRDSSNFEPSSWQKSTIESNYEEN